jgi:hypothetical protein
VTEFLTKKMEAHNLKVNSVTNPSTAFSSQYAAPVTPARYIKGLVKNFETSPGVLVIMLIYIERLLEKMDAEYKLAGGLDQILFTSYNAHRIILASFLVAQKYCEDKHYRLSSIARAGGVERDELINLETEFMNFLDFTLFVDEDTFNKYTKAIVVYSQQSSTN